MINLSLTDFVDISSKVGMSKMNINIGDVVMLKSGGPQMVVEDIGNFSRLEGPENQALCKWFIENELKQDIFKLAVLQKV